jgi:hypothetical protein
LPSPESLELARLFFRKGGEDLAAAHILDQAPGASDAVVGFNASGKARNAGGLFRERR